MIPAEDRLRRKSTSPSWLVEALAMLQIATDKVCFVVVKAREHAAKDVVTEPAPASNPADDRMVAVLEDHASDAVSYELKAFIGAMTEDEQIDLVALAWLGRGDAAVEEWPHLRSEAARARTAATADYLLGMPLLGDYLQEGLWLLGYSCQDARIGRL
jgi:hypothetical protein